MTSTAPAQEKFSVREILAMAKIAGACGILDSQVHFQKSTRLEGGEAFVFRYWSTEATRLGKTLQEYSDQCNQAISGYEKLWQASPD
jgi:hypothetical protein